MSDALAIARAALAGRPAWLVGGAVRDRLLDRPTRDFDIVVEADAEGAAAALSRAAHGPRFSLSEAFGAWRVLDPGGAWQVDLAPLAGASIDEDLKRRDFTVNALAQPLAGGELLDPTGGTEDLAARRLRMVSASALAADPLRSLRLARFGCELGFTAESATAAEAAANAPRLAYVAAERVFAELRAIIRAPAMLEGLRLMDEVGATGAVLPELVALRGVEQSDYHHLDVHAHTLAVLEALLKLESDPAAVLGAHAPAVAEQLAEPLADELTRGEALRLGALLHDIAKPVTRAVAPSGRVTFFGHDERGAELARAIMRRLRASSSLAEYVAALTRHHLRLGFLVHERPLGRRAIHRYLRACSPVEVEVTVLSVADRLATRGRNSDPAIAAHLELAGELLGEALRWRADAPHRAPLVRGDELAASLGIAPGPGLGSLLDEIEEARFAGEIESAEQAVAHARAVLAAGSDS